MWAAAWLQSSSWRFDLRSALIGAILAWGLAWLLYLRRTALRRNIERLQAPLVRWRARSRRSTSEKYLAALQSALRRLLLLPLEDPRQIFVPPTFLIPASLPSTSTEALEPAPPQVLPYANLLKGHPRLVLSGLPDSGRTTALATLVWESAQFDAATQRPFQRFPLWLDLALPGPTPEAKATPVQYLAELATRFMPQALPKWLARQLQTQPALILIDNWEKTPVGERPVLAQRFAEAAAALPQSVWVIATGTEGYGPLVEAGFTPIEIQPPLHREGLLELHERWSTALGMTEPQLRDEALATMQWALAAGDTLAELTLRIHLHLHYQETPLRPVDVIETFLRYHYLPVLGLEDTPEEAARAQQQACAVLAQLARMAWLEGRSISPAQVQEVCDQLVPLTDKQDKFALAVRKLVQSTPLLERQGKTLRFCHPLWEEFFTALALATEAASTDMEPLLLLEHLHDMQWRYLLDCYAGLSNAEPLIKALLREGLSNATLPEAEHARTALLLAARWTIRAPEDVPWRTFVIKALAKVFIQPNLSPDYRLKLSQALALIAAEQAYPLYLQALRHPLQSIRVAALRGIGWVGSPKDLKLLAAALKDPHLEIQESALHAIADLGTPGAYRFLGDLLPQSSEQLMLQIAEILARNPEGWDTLREAVQAEDLLVRRAVAHGLSNIPQPWARELLQQLARDDPQWLVRSAAEAALSAQQPSQVVVSAPPQPDQIQWLIAWAARQGLGLGVGPAAFTMLLHALQAGDTPTRLLAARTLSQIGRPEHLEALQALINDPDAMVQEAVRNAIQHIEARYRGLPPPSAPQEAPAAATDMAAA